MKSITPLITSCIVISYSILSNLLPSARPSYAASEQKNFIYIPLILVNVAQSPSVSPPFNINVPYFDGNILFSETAIFWFGRVDPTSNYTDVRIGFNNEELFIHLITFDRLLWYDPLPSPSDITDWDAASIYLNLSYPSAGAPGQSAYLFIAQLNWSEPRQTWQTTYRGDGNGWSPASISFTTISGWRGNAPNDNVDDRGWTLTYRIPFSSLGLSAPPSQDSHWGLAIVLHDRDDAVGTPIPDLPWPSAMDPSRPATWGSLSFGLPVYNPPPAVPSGSLTIRHGLNGALVPDAHVGGHTTCGQPYWPDFFTGWGDANYAGYEQINIQNQADVADWPCFSKYYLTFPLDQLPPAKAILSAYLKLHLFGNAGQGPVPAPQPSLIQVLTIQEDWNENTISWNNAPLAFENVAQTWVYPMDAWPGWPGIPYEWDLSRAVAKAYSQDQPLRLVLYSTDGAQNSGKYFTSSDMGDWNAAGRPALSIVWGEP